MLPPVGLGQWSRVRSVVLYVEESGASTVYHSYRAVTDITTAAGMSTDQLLSTLSHIQHIICTLVHFNKADKSQVFMQLHSVYHEWFMLQNLSFKSIPSLSFFKVV